MKKTISINIANRSFYIEEEAYNILNEYLQSIKMHYRKADPEGEIIGDIEERLSEIFESRKRLGHEVITLEITKEAMEQMGPLEDIIDETIVGHPTEHCPHHEEGSQEYKSKTQSHQTAEEKETYTQRRKLYKDPNDKWISGFLGGLAKYLDIDPTFIRLIFIILLFTPINGTLILLYIVFAIVIPSARTVSQRLEMEGKAVTPDSIWQKITEESSNITRSFSSRMNDIGSSFKASRDENVTATPTSPEEEKRKKRNNAIYWIISTIAVIGVILSLIYTLSSGFFITSIPWDNLTRYGLFEGRGLLFFLTIAIIAIMTIGILMLILISPIWLLVRSNASTIIKVIGILIWICAISIFIL